MTEEIKTTSRYPKYENGDRLLGLGRHKDEILIVVEEVPPNSLPYDILKKIIPRATSWGDRIKNQAKDHERYIVKKEESSAKNRDSYYIVSPWNVRILDPQESKPEELPTPREYVSYEKNMILLHLDQMEKDGDKRHIAEIKRWLSMI